MKKKNFSTVKYLLLLSIGIGLLWLAFRGQDLHKIFNDIKHANYWWVALSLVAALFADISRAHRWNMLITPLGYKPKLTSSLYSLMVGYLANLAIPRIGEISRCGSLNQAEKIPFSVLIGTVIVERVIDVITLLLLFLLLAFVEFNRLGVFIIDKIVHPVCNDLMTLIHNPFFIGLIVVVVILLILAVWYLKHNHTNNDDSIYSNIKTFLTGITQGIKTVVRMKNNFAFIAHTLFIWTMYFLITYFCFFAMESTSHLGLMAGMFTLVIGGIGMSAPVQGGIGIFHLLVSQGLTLYGIQQTDGLAFATITHTAQAVFIIAFGGLSLFLLLLSKKYSNDAS